MAHLCSLFHMNLSENQNRNLGTHLQMYAYAHNTTPLSTLKLSPYQIVFHTHPRKPLSFDLNSTRDSELLTRSFPTSFQNQSLFGSLP